MTDLYHAIAEHVTEGRAQDLNCEAFTDWLAVTDLGGDPTFAKFDEVLDELVARYRNLLASRKLEA